MKVVLASGNAGKVVEMREILGDEFALVSQRELGIDDADEPASTFVENALIKARHAAKASGLPAIGDDSGLCVDALDGAPGLYSARYAGTHGDARANIEKLLRELETVSDAKRGAYFYCCTVFLRHADDPAPIIGEGRWFGRILRAPRGSGGFGYDPIFFDTALNVGASEMESAIKNRVSHRGQALSKMRDALLLSHVA